MTRAWYDEAWERPVAAEEDLKVYGEEDIRRWNNQLRGHVRVKVDVRSALRLAESSPRREACTMGIMKCVASYGYVTLEQVRALLGLIAQRALRE